MRSTCTPTAAAQRGFRAGSGFTWTTENSCRRRCLRYIESIPLDPCSTPNSIGLVLKTVIDLSTSTTAQTDGSEYPQLLIAVVVQRQVVNKFKRFLM